MPDIPSGTLVRFVRANGPREGTVVGRYLRWVIVQSKPMDAPIMVPAASCTVVSHAA